MSVLEKEEMRWDRLRAGFKGRSTVEALEDFRKSTIFKDMQEFIYVNLEVFREMLEMDEAERSVKFDTNRSDSHVRGMIEVTKDFTFLVDNMVEVVLQQRQEEKEDADEDSEEREEGND